MRGLLIHPADVPVLIVFEDTNPQLWQQACQAWASLAPQQLEGTAAQRAEGMRLVVLSKRSAAEVQADYQEAVDVSLIDSRNVALAAETLTVHITMHLLKELAGSRHLLHAAALGNPRTGQTVALVAASGTGKTTAASFLGGHLTYLSDETAIIDTDTLRVSPYPKPLSIIDVDGQPKQQYDPASRGLTVAQPEQSFVLSHLVVLNRDKTGQEPLTWERLPLTEALFTIVEQSSGVQKMPRGLAQLADLINRVGGAIKLTYSEISQALPFFESLLAGELELAPRCDDYVYRETDPALGNSGAELCRYRRGRGTSGLESNDDFLLATEGKLTRISVIGWDIWEALASPLDAEELYASMQELYGRVPRPDFDAVVAGMVGTGMIEMTGKPAT